MPDAPLSTARTSRDAIAAILALFASRGSQRYDEDVTQVEHALQCARLAETESTGDALVVAALLHDVGHLLTDEDDRIPGDMRHEQVGASALAPWFGPEVTEPIRLHVAAKRYLCATEPAYASELSRASTNSLRVQGGPMSDAECAAFAARPHAADAVRLRRFDEQAKVTGLDSGSVEAFEGLLGMLVRGV